MSQSLLPPGAGTPEIYLHPENNARSWRASGRFAEGFLCLAGLPAHSTDSKVFIEQNDFLGIFLILGTFPASGFH